MSDTGFEQRSGTKYIKTIPLSFPNFSGPFNPLPAETTISAEIEIFHWMFLVYQKFKDPFCSISICSITHSTLFSIKPKNLEKYIISISMYLILLVQWAFDEKDFLLTIILDESVRNYI